MVAGYMGWDDLWWDSNSNGDIGHHNNEMRLGQGGILLLTSQFSRLFWFNYYFLR